jgi:Family of unknown function (DUF6497)
VTRAFPLLAVLALAACREDGPAVPDGAEVVPVPSGATVWLQEVITGAPGAEGTAMRFRFVDEALVAEDDRSADMEALCTAYALPIAQATVPPPRQIVISLAAAATPFGEAAPEVLQFFEAYRIEDGACIWELF